MITTINHCYFVEAYVLDAGQASFLDVRGWMDSASLFYFWNKAGNERIQSDIFGAILNVIFHFIYRNEMI